MESLSKEERDEMVTCFACMALHDGEAEITADQIKELIAATGNEVEPYWPMLFAKFVADKMDDLILTAGGGGGGVGPAAGAVAEGGAAQEEEKKEEEKKEEEEEVVGGMDMFGGGDDY